MKNYTGSTRNLLLSLKELIQDNRSRFPGLKREFVGIGFMGEQPQAPAISVLPVRWHLGRRYSGGKYGIVRLFEVHVLRDEKSNVNVNKSLREDVEKVQEILRIDERFRLKRDGVEQVFNYLPGDVNYESVPSLRFNARQAIMQFQFMSFGYRPLAKERRPVVRKDVADSEVYSEIFEIIKKNRKGALAKVKGFNRDSRTPKLKGLSLSVELATKNHNEERSSVDNDMLNFDISIFSKMERSDESYLSNVDVADSLVDIFEGNATLGGAAFDSNVRTINYGVDNDERMYRTEMNFECEIRRQSVNHVLL